MNKLFTLLIFFVLIGSIQAKVIFKGNYPVFQKASIIVDFVNQQSDDLNPQEICKSIYRNNSTVNNMRCRLAGELKRDTTFAAYANWLSYNISDASTPELLKIRSAEVSKKISNLVLDNYLLLMIKNEKTIWAVLFHGESTMPIALSKYKTNDIINGFDDLADDLFSKPSENIPTAAEREIMKSEPDEYYRTKLSLDHFYSFGIAYSAADAFFFPRNWVKGKTQNDIREFNKTRNGDSTSAWNWMEDAAYMPVAKVGLTYAKTLGVDMIFRWSTHNMKYNKNDSLHQDINEWYYNRFEMGLQARLGSPFFPTKKLEITPAAIVGFVYSFNVEHFEYDGDFPEADNRISFNKFYKGAIGGLSVKTLYNNWIGLTFETGLAYRGVIMDQDLSVEDVNYPEKASGGTIDYFTSLSVEFNIRKYLD